MNQENEKSKVFVQRLLANPALGPLNPLQKEMQIIQFLNLNKDQLYPTLSSPAFFPGKPWNEIFRILYISLLELIDEQLSPFIDDYLKSGVEFSFLTYLRERVLPAENIRKILVEFLKKMLKHPEARKEYISILTVLQYNFTEKYMNEIFENKSYIFFELTKVQRLTKMGSKEILNMVKLSLLLRPLIYIYNSGEVHSESGPLLLTVSHAEKIVGMVKEALAVLPDEIFTSAINSNVSFMDNQYLEATSRITAILTLMCKNYKPGMKVDRGAVSPEKSWINTARRNYRFFCFDIKKLDEFYKFAAENNW